MVKIFERVKLRSILLVMFFNELNEYKYVFVLLKELAPGCATTNTHVLETKIHSQKSVNYKQMLILKKKD